MRKGILLIVLSALLVACHQDTWRQRTIENLDLIKAHILTDSPGPIDPQNPHFTQRMSENYQTAVSMASRVQSYGGYYAVLNYFVNSFRDSNIYLSNFSYPEPVYYPGFMLTYNGKQATVSKVGYLSNIKNLPPVGAVFDNCYDDSLTQLMERNVFPYFGNDKSISDWYYNVPMMFVDYQNPFISWPKKCEFKVNGQVKTYTLGRHEISQRLAEHYYWLAGYSYQPKIGIFFPNPQTVWINWPTFNTVNNQTVWMMKKIIKQLPSLRNRARIVIDLRGNSVDGSRGWMTMLLSAIYGKNYYAWKLTQFPSVVSQFRVSQTAVNMLQSVTWRDQHAFGAHSVYFQQLMGLLQSLKAAFERGDQLLPQTVKKFVAPANLVQLSPQFNGQLDLVVDGRCDGKCLDFVELAKHFPHVRLLGKATAANTLYTQSVYPVFIDSGVALHFGVLKQVRRQRPSGKPFIPDIYYPGDINNTKALKAWVMEQNP